MPKYVKAIDIVDGMILAEDIKNRQGYLMLSKGMELGTKHIKVFTTWNIPGVLVESLEDNTPLDPESIYKAKIYLESLMNWECTTPFELDLFQVAVFNIAKNEQNRAK